MILSQYHIFELDTINIYSACGSESATMQGTFLPLLFSAADYFFFYYLKEVSHLTLYRCIYNISYFRYENCTQNKEKFLEIFDQYDFREFCLGYMFTYR